MTLFAVILVVVASFYLFRMPRQQAMGPLIVGASYMAPEQSIEIGLFHFTAIRILVAVGVLRVLIRRERVLGGWNSLDKLMVAWAAWAVCSSCFHEDFFATLVYRLGMVYDCFGFYFLVRVFIQNMDDIWRNYKVIIIALAPIALEMITEAKTGRDLFSLLGGVPELSEVRGGKPRAQGPFANPILAGTVGAVCLPMAVAFLWKNRRLFLLGLAVTGAMAVCSMSSGPMMAAILALFGLALWKIQSYVRFIRWSALLGLIALAMIMNAPVYYLIDRFNLTGHSTGWHRAYLIQSAIAHVGDWWLGGTDYTRDWTPEAGYDANNTDITNHYIRMAVWGGLPMLLLFIGSLVVAFNIISKALRANKDMPVQEQFLIWTLGCVLFAHVVSMVSVSYFDQSVVFFYFVLATISSIQAMTLRVEKLERDESAVDSAVSQERNAYHHC